MKPLRVRGTLKVGARAVDGVWDVAPGPDSLVVRAPGKAELPAAGEEWEAQATVTVLHTSDRGTVPMPVQLVLARIGATTEVRLDRGGTTVSRKGDVAAAVRALDAAVAPARLRACATCQLAGATVGVLGIECRLRPESEVVPAYAWCDGYERVGPPAGG